MSKKKLTPVEALAEMQKVYDRFHGRILVLKKRTTALVKAAKGKKDSKAAQQLLNKIKSL